MACQPAIAVPATSFHSFLRRLRSAASSEERPPSKPSAVLFISKAGTGAAVTLVLPTHLSNHLSLSLPTDRAASLSQGEET